MRKLQKLQDWIEAVLPEYAGQPERMALFADEGVVACTLAGETLSFQKTYQVTLQLWDCARDPDGIFAALLVWIARYERELLQSYAKNPQAISWAAEKLDGAKFDLEIKFPLSERVQVLKSDDGKGMEVTPLAEPFEGEAMRLWSLWLGPDQLVEWEAGDDPFTAAAV